MKTVSCVGCSGSFPDVEGPTHAYMTSCPGCWAVYGQVLAREYENPAYSALHRLRFDAYAVQHPGRPSPRAIQSVTLHLISLNLVLEVGQTPAEATQAIQKGTQLKGRFQWLEPPPNRGSVTVKDVVGASSPELHRKAVRTWAQSAWDAWGVHHDTIRALCAVLGFSNQDTPADRSSAARFRGG